MRRQPLTLWNRIAFTWLGLGIMCLYVPVLLAPIALAAYVINVFR